MSNTTNTTLGWIQNLKDIAKEAENPRQRQSTHNFDRGAAVCAYFYVASIAGLHEMDLNTDKQKDAVRVAARLIAALFSPLHTYAKHIQQLQHDVNRRALELNPAGSAESR